MTVSSNMSPAMALTSRAKAAPPVIALAVFIAAVALNLDTLAHGFVFDDLPNILQNRWISDPRSIGEIFTHHAAGFDRGFATSFYRPMMHLIYMATLAVFGLEPRGFHLVNIVLHGLTSVLVFLVTDALQGRLASPSTPPGRRGVILPLTTALLFAAHPIHSEAVAWLAGVTDLSFSLFYLLAFYLYLRAEEGRIFRLVLAGASYFVSTLCKEPALTLPIVLLGYEWLARRAVAATPAAGRTARALPFALATGLYLALRWQALGGIAPSGSHGDLGLARSLINVFPLLAAYLGKLVWPVALNVLHVFRPIDSLLDGPGLASIAGIVLLVVAVYLLRRQRLVILGVILVVTPLLPALYIQGLGESVFAERYLYLPCFGFALLIADLFERARRSLLSWQSAASAGALLLICVYAAATVSRNRVWRDDLSLWTDAVATSPDSAAAHEYLGYALLSRGRWDEAIASCRRSLAIDPTRASARTNLGLALAQQGQIDAAIQQYEAALDLRPDSAETCTSLGLAYAAKGWIDRALAAQRRAVELNPQLPQARNNLGSCYAAIGRLEQAVLEFREATRLDPANPQYRDNLAKAIELTRSER